jgi:hypothetical protein
MCTILPGMSSRMIRRARERDEARRSCEFSTYSDSTNGAEERWMTDGGRIMVRKGDGASRVKLAGNAARVGPDQLTSSTSLCGESFIAPTKNGAAVLATLGLAKEGMV